jgi:hypothetical protein
LVTGSKVIVPAMGTPIVPTTDQLAGFVTVEASIS